VLRLTYDDLKHQVERAVGPRPVTRRPALILRYELEAEFGDDELGLDHEPKGASEWTTPQR